MARLGEPDGRFGGLYGAAGPVTARHPFLPEQASFIQHRGHFTLGSNQDSRGFIAIELHGLIAQILEDSVDLLEQRLVVLRPARLPIDEPDDCRDETDNEKDQQDRDIASIRRHPGRLIIIGVGILQGGSPMLAIVAAAALSAQLRFVKLRIYY